MPIKSISNNTATVAPIKDRYGSRSVSSTPTKSLLENSNPNSEANGKVSKERKKKHSASRVVESGPENRVVEKKFVVAKRKKSSKSNVVSCKCKKSDHYGKCVCVAYENLRASREEFFRIEGNFNREKAGMGLPIEKNVEVDGEEKNELGEECVMVIRKIDDMRKNVKDDDARKNVVVHDKRKIELGEDGLMVIRKSDDARMGVPEKAGKVMSLVHAFESLLVIPTENKGAKDGIAKQQAFRWFSRDIHVPGSASCFSPSEAPDVILTSENLGLNSCVDVLASWESSSGRNSNGSRRNRRHSTDSTGIKVGRQSRKKHHSVTSLKPFQLRTEQRGKMKEEELIKRLQEMVVEQERQRIPVAQGLPWTTDEPECLLKPSLKEITIPVDLKLNTDMRAVERAEFDQQVAEKMSSMEQYKKERERQHQLEEEESIRRLRKELIPKAQPMPYFDRPFIPKRPTKLPTIPREPKFHTPEHKKSQMLLVMERLF